MPGTSALNVRTEIAKKMLKLNLRKHKIGEACETCCRKERKLIEYVTINA